MKKRPLLVILILIITLVILFIAFPRFVSAVGMMEDQFGPTFTVNTIDDHDDGQCTVGDCTLREAINAANTLTDTNTITFELSGTITLTDTLPGIDSEMTIDGSGQPVTISGDDAWRVLVISNTGTLTLNSLTIADGLTDDYSEYGAGLLSYGTLTVTNSTFKGNHAASSAGGGMSIEGGSATIINSTITGNGAFNGGGVYLYDGTHTIINTTISGNSGGGIGYLYGTTTIYNSIITDNPGDYDCYYFGVGAVLTADSYNIDGDGSCDNATTRTPEQLKLAPLADNGGETETMALLIDSAAINAGDNAVCETADQRGVARPQSGICDVGAYEFDACTGFPMSAANETDLNNAIYCYSLETVSAVYTITLTADIPLTAATQPIDNAVSGVSLVVAGSGFTVDGQGILDARPFDIQPDTEVTLAHLTVTGGNSSITGGGILNAGSLTLQNAAVVSNTALAGGGITQMGPMLTINNSTISDNTASFTYGGGIQTLATGVLVIETSTISGNRAGSNGGGVGTSTNQTVTILNSTIANNTADYDNGGIAGDGGGISAFSTALISIVNTIIADNVDGSGGSAPDCVELSGGTIISLGYNLIGDTTGCTLSTQSSDILDQDPLLEALADNGGETQTHALPLGSPAVNQIPPIISGCGTTATADQRGVTRPQQSGCDMGAFEYDPCGVGFPMTAGSESTLNEAITCYNALTTPGSYEINLTADITLSDNTTPVDNSSDASLQMNGSGHVIDGAGSYRPLKIVDGDVTIDGITLQHGLALNDCGDIVVIQPRCGGAIKIQSGAVVTLTNSTIFSNTANIGGGLFNHGGTMTIINSDIISNVTDYRVGGIGNRDSVMTIVDSTISGNSSFTTGGVSNEGTAVITITGSLITDNHTDFADGGMSNEENATIVNSTISGNSATAQSGGVGNRGTMAIINSTITENTTNGSGGGLLNSGDSLTGYNNIIANNAGGDCDGVMSSDVDATNLDSDGTCGDAVQSANINLGPLQDNGGPTFTHALLSGSDALYAGDNAICAAAPVNNLDQRGVTRPQGSACDIGAYERVNTAPVAVDDGYDTDKNTVLVVSAPGVLDNDSDGDNDSLTAVLVTGVSSGTLDLSPDGSFTYTPTLDFVGDDTFTYKANDGGADSNTATVTITVNSVCPTFPIMVADEAGLNEAIDCYNAEVTPGSYTIDITADITLTAPITPVDNANNASLQVNGNGHTIDGAGSYRPFTLVESNVTIDNVVLQNALATATCTVSAPTPRCGGAVHVSSTAVLTLTNSTIQNSTATLGGGLYNQGGVVTISNSDILSNTSPNYRGGGIGNRSGQMTIIDSTIAGNTGAYGGGISNESTGVITITGSTISGNNGTLSTGAMYSEGDAMTISNSTISGNFSSGGDIGGILNNSDTALVVNTTIANNTAGTGPGFDQGIGLLTLRNTIIAGSGGDGDCEGVTGAMANDTNLDSDGSCGDAVQSADINLGPLQDNGGPTETHALLFGSDALDMGDSAICAAAPVNNVDQRGMARPQGPGCDIGAYEAAPFEVRTLTVILSGTGQGTVTSVPVGIDCMPDCSEDYEVGTVVTLTAAAENGSTFAGWQGPCSGTGSCVVTMDQAQTVTAVFNTNTNTYQLFMPVVLKAQ